MKNLIHFSSLMALIIGLFSNALGGALAFFLIMAAGCFWRVLHSLLSEPS